MTSEELNALTTLHKAGLRLYTSAPQRPGVCLVGDIVEINGDYITIQNRGAVLDARNLSFGHIYLKDDEDKIADALYFYKNWKGEANDVR